MAGALSGIVQQQPLPAAQLTQPAAVDRTPAQASSDPVENEVQPQQAPAAQSQETNLTSDQGFSDTIALVPASAESAVPSRGSSLDITI